MVTDKQTKAVGIPDNWNELSDDEKFHWTEAALSKLVGNVKPVDRRASEKR